MVRDWFEKLLHPRCQEAKEVSRDLAIKRAVTNAKLRELQRISERDANVEAILNGFFPKDEGH